MKKSELVFVAVKPPLDFLALIAAALTAYFIRYLPAVQQVRPVIFDLPFQNYISIVISASLVWIAVFALSGLYYVSSRRIVIEFGRIFVASSAGMALVLAVMVFSRYLFDSRFIILAAWVLAIIFVSAERLLIEIARRLAYLVGFGIHRIVIIGEGGMVPVLVSYFQSHPSKGYRVVGTFSGFNEQCRFSLENMVKNDAVDDIIHVNPNANIPETSALLDFANDSHLTFRYAADLLGTQLSNSEVTTIAGTPIIEVKHTSLDGWGRIAKRIFDIIGSVVLIVVTLPVMIVTTIAIKLNSPGPVLFRYKRIGQYGRPFRYFKFRSMIHNAHEYRFDDKFLAEHPNVRAGSPMMKFQGDPRITAVGRFIRRFSIDELPELFIVLIGSMSLVGPRPHEVEEVERYQRHHRKVLTIKPGMTGISQVSGRSDLPFNDEVKLDTYYIENWSLGLDLQILFKTPGAVLRRRRTE